MPQQPCKLYDITLWNLRFVQAAFGFLFVSYFHHDSFLLLYSSHPNFLRGIFFRWLVVRPPPTSLQIIIMHHLLGAWSWLSCDWLNLTNHICLRNSSKCLFLWKSAIPKFPPNKSNANFALIRKTNSDQPPWRITQACTKAVLQEIRYSQ